MEACSLPRIPKFSQYVNNLDCGGPPAYLNPVVVLTDFRKNGKRPPEKTEACGQSDPGEGPGRQGRHYSPKLLTPPRSTPSPSLIDPRESGKRRRLTWNPEAEYEIERILGHRRDEKDKMWYLVKWKGWSDEHNTFEPIENLTRCNFILMKTFEASAPSKAALKAKEAQVERSLRARPIYEKLREGRCTADDLEEFSRQCPDLGRVFLEKDLTAFERDTREEYGWIVRCLVSMRHEEDPGLFLRAETYRFCLKLIKRRRKQLKKLAKAEARFNALEDVPVRVENNLDLDHLPEFEYVVEMKLGEGVVVPKDPLLGCECSDGCNPRSHCCGKMGDSAFAYTLGGRLRLAEKIAIYECNWRCRCPMSCPNRVVQHGRQVELCIFKTSSCGWGVKALQRIPKGAFVCEYLGELIRDSEAAVRDASGEKGSYLFDLDYCPDLQSELYCVDATKCGNVARFINHSCDPNLVVYPVWVDCLEPNLQRLAFFARRNIRKDEEIHFDYENLPEEVPEADEPEGEKNSHRLRMTSRERCQCRAPNCRKWVFGSR